MNRRDVIRRHNQVMALHNQGMRTGKIAQEVGLTQRTVQTIVRDRLGMPMNRKGGKSVENRLGHLRIIIIQILTEQGRVFDVCELCHDHIPPGKFDLHHTKYDGATINDLLIVCRACNTSAENKYLD